MRAATKPLSTFTMLAGISLCAGLVAVGSWWPDLWLQAETPDAPAPTAAIEVLKLAIAAGIGTLVTTVHQPAQRGRKSTKPVVHAQILFCVAGALMIIIIGNSLARAFGALGVASIVRFRTSLKDPEDATVLFLLIGLGMSAGRGILAVSGLGTLFLCALLLYMHRARVDGTREALLEVRTSAGADLSASHVESVLVHHGATAEPTEIIHGAEPMVRYRVSLGRSESPSAISAELLDEGRSGITAVKWEMLKPKDE
jgi:hypothetical protein